MKYLRQGYPGLLLRLPVIFSECLNYKYIDNLKVKAGMHYFAYLTLFLPTI